MFGNKYKFTNKKHSVGGVISTIMALIAIVMFVISVMYSFKAGGNGGEEVGLTAFISLIFSVFGLVTGLLSYREYDRYYTFSFAGSFTNGIVTIAVVMLMLAGM